MIFLLIIEYALSQNIYLSDSFNNTWIIYNNVSGYNPQFFWPHEQCCTPPPLEIINATQQTNFMNTVTFTSDSYQFSDFKVQKSYKGYTTNVSINVEEQYLKIDNICDTEAKANKEELNESGIVYLKLITQDLTTNTKETFVFHYWFVCQYSAEGLEKTNYDLSMQIVIIIGCLCVWIYAKSYKIRSLRIKIPNPARKPWLLNIIAAQPYATEQEKIYFQGFKISWIAFVIFFIVAGGFYLIYFLFPDNWYNAILILVMVCTFFCCWFYFNEIFYFLPVNFNLQKRVFWFFQICDFISILCSAILVALYLVLHQPWYLSTIIAFCLTGTITRLFKVTSLISVTIFYSLIIVYDSVLLYAFISENEMNYQIKVLMDYNYPVYFEIPQFKAQLNKLCCWISVLDLLVPALSIAYLYRFGKNHNTRSYFIISMIGLLVGIMFWAFVAFQVGIKGKQIAQSFLVLPILIISACLWAKRQGQFRILFYGTFYDRYLMEDFSLEQFNESKQKENELSDKIKGQLDDLLKDFEQPDNQ